MSADSRNRPPETIVRAVVEWVKAGSSVATALVAIAGAAWVLYNFGLERISKAKVLLDAEALATDRYPLHSVVQIRVRAENVGRTGMKKVRAFVQVAEINDPGQTDRLRRLNNPSSRPHVVYSLFSSHTFLEPGEKFIEDLLIQTSTSTRYLELRILLYGPKPIYTWSTHRIVRLDDVPDA